MSGGSVFSLPIYVNRTLGDLLCDSQNVRSIFVFATQQWFSQLLVTYTELLNRETPFPVDLDLGGWEARNAKAIVPPPGAWEWESEGEMMTLFGPWNQLSGSHTYSRPFSYIKQWASFSLSWFGLGFLLLATERVLSKRVWWGVGKGGLTGRIKEEGGVKEESEFLVSSCFLFNLLCHRLPSQGSHPWSTG